jgi:hypothetical protein
LCFIFCWKNHFENVVTLEKQLLNFCDVVVINADENNKLNHWINVGDSYYFSDKFRKSLDLFDMNKYDYFFHIQGDVEFNDWGGLLKRSKEFKEKYNWGVYAPNVDYTFYNNERTDVFSLEKDLYIVANTDNTCWIITKDIIQEMKTNLILMKDNNFGWGFDLLICAFAHLKHRPVIRDYRFTVNHPASTGYKKHEAEQEMVDMINSAPKMLKEIMIMIKTNHKNIAEFYGIDNREIKEDNIFVYDTTR